jgi:hypothetical protein
MRLPYLPLVHAIGIECAFTGLAGREDGTVFLWREGGTLVSLLCASGLSPCFFFLVHIPCESLRPQKCLPRGLAVGGDR